MVRTHRWTAVIVCGLLLTGCAQPAPQLEEPLAHIKLAPAKAKSTRAPGALPSWPADEFRVGTTLTWGTLDPAFATSGGDELIAYNSFQRVLTAKPDTGEVKPDLAEECLFTDHTTYECTLPKDSAFHNGHPLTSSDVVFSIMRAKTLGAGKISGWALRSLSRVEAVSPRRVKFVLSWADTQFPWALTAPFASVVDEEVFPATAEYVPPAGSVPTVEPTATATPSPSATPKPLATVFLPGSGAYVLKTFAPTSATFERYMAYIGPSQPEVRKVAISVVGSARDLETSLLQRSYDVVWRDVSELAKERVERKLVEGHHLDLAIYGVDGGPNVETLTWRRKADDNERLRLATAAREVRVWGSLLPPGPEALEAYPIGIPEQKPGAPLTLSLGYAARDAMLHDRAMGLAAALAPFGITLVLKPGAPGDVELVRQTSWCKSAMGWLGTVAVSSPADGKFSLLDKEWRLATDEESRRAALSKMQLEAASELTVLPLRQGRNVAYFGESATAQDKFSFGPGYQLLFSAFRRSV